MFAPPSFTADASTGAGDTTSSTNSFSKPGKTAPRLLHDATLLDVQNPLKYIDILADAPPHFIKTGSYPIIRNDKACAHSYALNWARTKVPPEDYRSTAGDLFWIEAVCRRCRSHIHLDLKYSSSGRRPCPNNDYPLHHFIRQKAIPNVEYIFQCSSPDCGAILTLKYYPKVISDIDLDLLTNPNLLRRRYDEGIAKHGPLRGLLLATGLATLWKLRRYIRDSLMPGGAEKKVPLENKRFLESFGTDCDELLSRLGFRKQGEGEDAVFALPSTNPEGMDSDRIYLENWDMELEALIDQYVARDGDLHPCPDYMWCPALPEMARLLSTQSYKKSPQSLNESNPNAQDHPFYASLGSMRDFADELIIFAYDRQSDCDPPNAPYYFDCLQDLANGRQSEELITKTSYLESQGVVGQQAVTEAYSFLSIDPKSNLTDNQIVDRFRSRMSDTAPSQQQTARAMLKRIGTVRQSRLIIDTASDTIETYAQALSWLGAEETYPDDSVLTLYTTKVADSPESEKQARKAVQVIADTRNSDPLRSWLSTGEMRDSGMSVDDACSHLKISLKDVDETMLQVVFENARTDNPGWKTEQAIDTVTKAYQKPDEGPQRDPSTWPVGLTSHGNTCYLNSLLQYYFTIKPLRELVLNFDKYKFDLSHHKGKIERVGARRVTPLEIRAYQKFVNDLKHLFERMIKDRGPAVKPEADLVCRAFLQAEDTEAITANPSRAHSPPSDIGIEEPPAKPPRPPKDHSSLDESGPPMPPRPAPRADEESDASSHTLGSKASSETLGDDNVDRKRRTQSKDLEDVEMADAKPITTTINPPTPPDSPTLPSSLLDPSGFDAPPLPPRPVSTPVRQQTNLAKAEDAARQQQDVTEVMDEILFRLRCAITSRGMDTREEQIDAFRDIFYMRISEKTLENDGKIVSREEDALNILLNIPSRPTDIYAALDEVFELQTIDHGTKRLQQYKTIQTLPPILQVNIPRNTFDRTTGRGVKVEHKIHLEEYLYLDRYYEWQETDVLERRKSTWSWRQRLDLLQAQKDVINRDSVGMAGPAKLDIAASYIRNLANSNEALVSLDLAPVVVEDNVAHDLEAMAAAQRTQLQTIDEEMTALQTRIKTQFEDLHEIKYRLHAVFFHRGGYGHGHYWTCINDFQNGMWRQYNDEKVEEFTKLNDIYDAETWQQGTPTYAVYVKDNDDVLNYVQSVCRKPEQEPLEVTEIIPAPVDEVMQDAPPPPNYPPPNPQSDKATLDAERKAKEAARLRRKARPITRIQTRGLRSTSVTPRAAEALAAQDPEDDPFGLPLPGQFVDPDEAAKQILERQRIQRQLQAKQQEEWARERARSEEQESAKIEEELASEKVFAGDNAAVVQSAPVERGPQSARDQARIRHVHAGPSQPPGPPHAAFRRIGMDTLNSRSDGAGRQGDVETLGKQKKEPARKARQQGDSAEPQSSQQHIAPETTLKTSSGSGQQPPTPSSNSSPRKQGFTITKLDGSKSQAGATTSGFRFTDSESPFAFPDPPAQKRMNPRDKALADIAEKMNIKAMPRLDRDRIVSPDARLAPKKKAPSFSLSTRGSPRFPSFSRTAQEATVGEGNSEWARADVPDVPPEIQARIDGEKRLAEQQRMEEERQKEETRLAEERRKVEQQRRQEEMLKEAERKRAEAQLLEEQRLKDAERRESERRLREAARQKQKQEQEARQIAQAARWSAAQESQRLSNESILNTMLSRATFEGTPVSQPANPGADAKVADADTFSFKVGANGQLATDMSDEEIDLAIKLLALRRAKRTKPISASQHMQDSEQTPPVQSPYLSQETRTQALSFDLMSPGSKETAPTSAQDPAVPVQRPSQSQETSPQTPSFDSGSSESKETPPIIPQNSAVPQPQPTKAAEQPLREATQSPGAQTARQQPPRNDESDLAKLDGASMNGRQRLDNVPSDISDLMRQGMMAGGEHFSPPMISPIGDSEPMPQESNPPTAEEPPQQTPAARDVRGRSTLLPFEPSLTSSWSIFKPPGRKDDQATPSPSGPPAQESTNIPSSGSLRTSRTTVQQPGDNPFTTPNIQQDSRAPKRTCNICGQADHIAFFCPERKKRNRDGRSNVADVRDRKRDDGQLFRKVEVSVPRSEISPEEPSATVAPTVSTSPETIISGPDAFDLFEQQLNQEQKPAPRPPANRAEEEPRSSRTPKSSLEEDFDAEGPPQITLRSRKFAEPEDDSRSQRKARRGRRDDDDDFDEDFGSRRKGGRRSSARDEDDDDEGPRRSRRRDRNDEDELDELSGARKIRDKRQRERDERRQIVRQAEQRKAALAIKRSQALTKITLPQFITVSRLAQALGVKLEPFTRKMESLGFTDTAHDHVLSAENASLIALEFNFNPSVGSDLEVIERDLKPRPEPEDKSDLPVRPPIVTIMGHVDHGKTTILDYLRKSSIAASEHGGITQHIGAFSVSMTGGKTITFLDTPGHAAFLSMRKRGANVTDIVILVVAADDSVKPQTLEALKHAREAKVPILVAVNKVDKPEADVQRVKNDLSRYGVEIEDFGGDVQVVSVSGKTGQGMDDLEEAIVTLGEILDHRAEVEGLVEGWVLEATTKAAGRVATVLVRRGTLKTGDVIVAGQTWTKVRTLRNEAGAEVAEAGPGTPVEVDGWRDQPVAGDSVLEAVNEQKATDVVEYREELAERLKLAEDVEAINEARRSEQERREREKADAEAKAAGEDPHDTTRGETKTSAHREVPFIIKADVSGSAEAVVGYLQQLMNPLVSPKILRSAVGAVTEFDIEHASAAQGHIICFNLPSPSDEMSGMAQHNKVKIIEQNVIYRLVDQVKAVLEEKLEPVITQRVIGEAEVLKPFDISIGGRKKLRIAGSRVRNGEIRRSSKVRVLRNGKKIYDGTIDSLKNVKRDVAEMRKGTECGIGFENWTDAQEGDQIQTYEEISEKRSLPL
ncbi:Translation initiation factor IF-2 [Sphaceloma murrayae]|uniref:Translation initiation factor IF-2, mitochondrial n=1 Tax=Sphaceloma murrayae TaxID=2082308 RepID=A0A2K1R1Y2_9PEZI|nr:Translation initiation factor IF-2 [Sphaceloma murrayae]